MKKIMLTVLLLLLTLALTLSAAADGVTIQLSAPASLNRGDSITVIVAVSEFENCKSGALKISYNEELFSRSGNEWLLSGTALAVADGDAVFAFSGGKTVSGDIYRFTLTAKEDADFKSADISVSLELRSASGGTASASQKMTVTVVCEHSYDNACDPDCNICGAKRSITHSYDGGKVTTEPTCTAEGVKTFTCSGCGGTYTEPVAKTEHTYNGGEVSLAATCTEKGVKTYSCTACGAAYTESIPATGHSYDNACDTDCNSCGKTRNVEHSYSNRWSFDANGHWHECTVCGDCLEMEAHVPGPEATEETDQICTVCGYVIVAAHAHEHTPYGDWLSNETGHYHQCACGEIIDSAEHTWDEGTTDTEAGTVTYYCTECGYPRTEVLTPDETQPTEPSQPSQPTAPTEQTQGGSPLEKPGQTTQSGEDGFPWWLIIAIVGVLLLGAIVFVIVGILLGKKQTGRYTK